MPRPIGNFRTTPLMVVISVAFALKQIKQTYNEPKPRRSWTNPHYDYQKLGEGHIKSQRRFNNVCVKSLSRRKLEEQNCPTPLQQQKHMHAF